MFLGVLKKDIHYLLIKIEQLEHTSLILPTPCVASCHLSPSQARISQVRRNSGSCRRVSLFEDLKLRREEEKREQRTTGVVYIRL